MLEKVRNGEKITWAVTGWDERVPPLKKPRPDVLGRDQGLPSTTPSETTPSVTEGEQNRASDNSKSSPPQRDKGGSTSKDQTYFLPDDNDNELERYGRSIGEAGAGRGGEAARRRGET